MSPAPEEGVLPAGLWATHAHLPPLGPPSQAAVQKSFSRFHKGCFSRRKKIGSVLSQQQKRRNAHLSFLPPPQARSSG